HHYDAEELKTIFSQARFSNSVLKAISRPAEALPWYKYRPIFLKPDRINQGVAFFEKYRDILLLAEKNFG
ncbi:MAG: lytic murein transglycosylase B, partial [Candidatus Dadabacteria bacterium]|nr:lytic murein transglycosylase B [Candidatus Dadabacteria bacterium]